MINKIKPSRSDVHSLNPQSSILNPFQNLKETERLFTPSTQHGTNDSDPCIIHITELEQVGMVVRDIQASMEAMWNTFHIGPWNVFVYEPDRLRDVRYYGEASKSGMKLALCTVGKMQMELLEPIGDDNIYRDFEKCYGNGVQHLGWHKVKTEPDFFETIQKLEKGGFSCIWSGRSPRARFAYFDTYSVLHTLLEVVWFDPVAPVQLPDAIFPSNITV